MCLRHTFGIIFILQTSVNRYNFVHKNFLSNICWYVFISFLSYLRYSIEKKRASGAYFSEKYEFHFFWYIFKMYYQANYSFELLNTSLFPLNEENFLQYTNDDLHCNLLIYKINVSIFWYHHTLEQHIVFIPNHQY